jgi:sulfur relay (sulfurtransferase) complex TusBCD TusD component (DsrE family)
LGLSRRVPKKEPYERPRVMKIVVVAEEMAVTGCKTARQRRGPTTGCVRVSCRLPGS